MFYPIVVDGRVLLFVWLVASALAIIGWLAIWAGLSWHHWFVGAATLSAVIALLAAVPACDLMLAFIVQSLMVMVPLRMARLIGWPAALHHNREISRKLQIRLKDLFLLVLAAGGLMFFIINMPDSVRAKSRDYLLCGVGAGLASLAAVAAVFARWPIAIRFVGLLVAPILAGLLPAATVLDESDPLGETLLGWAGYPEWLWCAMLPLTAVVIAIGLALVRRDHKAHAPAEPLGDPPPRSIWRPRACIGVFLAAVVAMPP